MISGSLDTTYSISNRELKVDGYWHRAVPLVTRGISNRELKADEALPRAGGHLHRRRAHLGISNRELKAQPPSGRPLGAPT